MRNQFLEAIAAYAPKVLKDLYDAAFKTYCELRHRGLSHRQVQRNRADSTELRESLTSWSLRWHLDASWCILAAYETFRVWSYEKGTPPTLFFQPIEFDYLVDQTVFIVKLPKTPGEFTLYRPHIVRRDEYLRGIRVRARHTIETDPLLKHGNRRTKTVLVESVAEFAKSYCLDVEHAYDLAKWKRCRSGQKRNLDQHLKWTVEFQVNCKTITRIAMESGAEDAGGVEKSTVLRAVDDLLLLTGLVRRAGAKPGRPQTPQRT